jgi:hypothetical protein
MAELAMKMPLIIDPSVLDQDLDRATYCTTSAGY